MAEAIPPSPSTCEQRILIEAPVEAVYAYWTDVERFARFLPSVLSVLPIGPDTTHWHVRGPLGTEVTFEAHITQHIDGRRIAWSARHAASVFVPESTPIHSRGAVDFQPSAGDATELRVFFSYTLPDSIAPPVTHLLRSIGYPDQEISKALTRIKRRIEAATTTADTTT